MSRKLDGDDRDRAAIAPSSRSVIETLPRQPYEALALKPEQFWRQWAQGVLAEAGLTLAPIPAACLGDPEGLEAMGKAWVVVLQQLHAFRRRASPRSAEWFAAGIEIACRIAKLSPVLQPMRFGEEPAAVRVARLIGELLATVERARLSPLVQKGRDAQAHYQRAGAAAAKAREENLGRTGWRELARRYASFLEEPEDQKGKARVTLGWLKRRRPKLSLSLRTVEDAIARPRTLKSR